MSKRAIAGYLVIDELPVARIEIPGCGGDYFGRHAKLNIAASVFPSRSAAMRVRLHLQRRYREIANRCDPAKSEKSKRLFEQWRDRAMAVRICAVTLDGAKDIVRYEARRGERGER